MKKNALEAWHLYEGGGIIIKGSLEGKSTQGFFGAQKPKLN